MIKIFVKILSLAHTLGIVCGFVPSTFEAENDVLFLLRIKNVDFNNEEVLTLNTRENLENTLFDTSKPIIFHVHGFIEDRRTLRHLLMDEQILNSKDVNLFFVDWGKGAKTIDYGLARKRIHDVAKVIGEFINFMNEKYSIKPSNIWCVGFSLGAHACGLIHKHLSKGNLEKVYGLDPAGPLFSQDKPDERISSNSASYVECIHTSSPLGIRLPICGVDFFVNRGISQPGCMNVFGIDDFSCSHYRAVEIFIEALKNPKGFYGISCNSFEKALQGKCTDEPGSYILDSNSKSDNRSKIFHVKTNDYAPYGRGKK